MYVYVLRRRAVGSRTVARHDVWVNATIRRATPADAYAIVDLLGEVWPHFVTHREETVTSCSRQLTNDGQLGWVAVRADTIVAAAVAEPLPRPRMVAGAEADVDFRYLVVTTRERCKGVGAAVEAHVTADLRDAGHTIAVVDVEDTNERGKKFWSDRGWSFRAQEINPGHGGSSRAVFMKSLLEPGGSAHDSTVSATAADDDRHMNKSE